jgi:N-acetylglutamate synthase-like GNAT family acetyltransferase
MPPPSAHASTADVRIYDDADYAACRVLWAELTEHHRRLYDDATIGGDDPGHGFDAYLAESARSHSWVAEVEGRVIGLAGLLVRAQSGEIEPVVVAAAYRREGLGRRLILCAVGEARTLGLEYVTLRPVTRNVDAIRSFHAAGFRTLGAHVDLTMDLTTRKHEWQHGAVLHGCNFDY